MVEESSFLRGWLVLLGHICRHLLSLLLVSVVRQQTAAVAGTTISGSFVKHEYSGIGVCGVVGLRGWL